MYKSQMKFQKIVCFMVLIASAVAFVYSLGLVTDLYETLYQMIPDPNNYSTEYVPGAEIFYDIQPFNRRLTIVALVLILISVFMMIMNTHTRRKYYIGNYVAIAVSVIANVSASVWALVNVMNYKNQYLTNVDFDALEMWAGIWDTPSGVKLFWFNAAYVVFGLLLLSTVLLVLNLIWKISVTNAENKLIAEGKEVA